MKRYYKPTLYYNTLKSKKRIKRFRLIQTQALKDLRNSTSPLWHIDRLKLKSKIVKAQRSIDLAKMHEKRIKAFKKWFKANR